ncbi:MAG TPA: DUF4124 domain-containing protein [Steroidobacteraceae bacterium]|nr:DUF4124 domain-containing protein [Steroidobacteraceae bacterium]
MTGWLPRLLLPALLVALCAGLAHAQSGKDKTKLYRWVDKEGQVHYGDRVPPEYAEQDRDILNRQGVPIAREQGLITAEEAAEQAAIEKAARDEQKRKLRDRVLLQTYQSVRELEVLRDNRLELVDAQLTIQEQSLANLRAQRIQLQKHASRYAPVNKDPKALPLPEEIASDLTRATSDIATQEANLLKRREERENIRLTFEADIKRYKELRAVAPR